MRHRKTIENCSSNVTDVVSTGPECFFKSDDLSLLSNLISQYPRLRVRTQRPRVFVVPVQPFFFFFFYCIIINSLKNVQTSEWPQWSKTSRYIVGLPWIKYTIYFLTTIKIFKRTRVLCILKFSTSRQNQQHNIHALGSLEYLKF